MYGISDAFKANIISENQVISVLAEVYVGGILARNITSILNGYVNVDKTAENRRTCTITVLDPYGDLTPTNYGDLLTPAGTELKLYRGFVLPDGSTERTPLGVFRITETAVQDSGQNFEIQLMGKDRSYSAKLAPFTDFVRFANNTDAATAILAILIPRINALQYSFTATTYPIAAITFNPGADPWSSASKIAESIGASLFFDANGILVLQTDVSPSPSNPVWSYVEGPTNTLLYADRRWNQDEVFNSFQVTGENTSISAPVSALAEDLAVLSPTYVYGIMGRHTKQVQSPIVTSVGAALSMANKLLWSRVGFAEQIDFPGIVNPAHDVDDIIAISTVSSKIGGSYVIDKLTIPLEESAAMSVTCRKIA